VAFCVSGGFRRFPFAKPAESSALITQGAPAQACRPLMSPRRSIRKVVMLQTPMSFAAASSVISPRSAQRREASCPHQQLLTSIERPRCSRCQTRMMLERVSPGPIGFEDRLFERPRCDHVESWVAASDPFNSNATGWFDGELRAPN
jgi:hypothetical protein